MNIRTSRDEMKKVGDLLLEAMSIERDLTGILADSPGDKSVLKLRNEYGKIVNQLAIDYEVAINSYLKTLTSTLQCASAPIQVYLPATRSRCERLQG
jgi:hypothetical protein